MANNKLKLKLKLKLFSPHLRTVLARTLQVMFIDVTSSSFPDYVPTQNDPLIAHARINEIKGMSVT